MTKLQAGTIHTSQVMDCQVRAIGKAIRPLFADQVTFILYRDMVAISIMISVTMMMS